MRKVVGKMIKLRWDEEQSVRVPVGSVYYKVTTDGEHPFLVIGAPEEENGEAATWVITLLSMGKAHPARGQIFGDVLWRTHHGVVLKPYLAFFGWVQAEEELSP